MKAINNLVGVRQKFGGRGFGRKGASVVAEWGISLIPTCGLHTVFSRDRIRFFELFERPIRSDDSPSPQSSPAGRGSVDRRLSQTGNQWRPTIHVAELLKHGPIPFPLPAGEGQSEGESPNRFTTFLFQKLVESSSPNSFSKGAIA